MKRYLEVEGAVEPGLDASLVGEVLEGWSWEEGADEAGSLG